MQPFSFSLGLRYFGVNPCFLACLEPLLCVFRVLFGELVSKEKGVVFHAFSMFRSLLSSHIFGKLLSAEDMEVQVLDRLSAVLADIGNDAVACG